MPPRFPGTPNGNGGGKSGSAGLSESVLAGSKLAMPVTGACHWWWGIRFSSRVGINAPVSLQRFKELAGRYEVIE
jgi:hypothetical protein